MCADVLPPRVGCGAAIVEGGKLLLVRRRRDPEAGCWGLPGGKVDPFETLTAATAREIHEELDIIIKPREMLCLVEQIDHVKGDHWIAPVFLIEEYTGTPVIMEPEALSDLGWFEINALPGPLTQATQQAVAAINRSSSGLRGGLAR